MTPGTEAEADAVERVGAFEYRCTVCGTESEGEPKHRLSCPVITGDSDGIGSDLSPETTPEHHKSGDNQ